MAIGPGPGQRRRNPPLRGRHPALQPRPGRGRHLTLGLAGPDRLRLTWFLPERPGQVLLLEAGRRYRVGRREDSEVSIPDPRVSREHALLDATGPVWRLADLASKNGTRVDGRPVDRLELNSRSWLSIGGVPVLAEPLGGARVDADHKRQGRLREATERIRRALPQGRAGEQLIRRCLEALRGLTEADRALLLLPHASGPLRIFIATGRERRAPPSRSVIDQVFATGRPVYCSDTRGAEALAGRQSVQAGGIQAIVALPVVHGDRKLGVIYADSRKPGKLFTELDAELVEGVADQIRLALASARVREAIEAMRSDPGRDEAALDPEFRDLLAQLLPTYRAD